MKIKIIEVTNGFNWGKFLLARFDVEWQYRSQLEDDDFGGPLLFQLGWRPEHLWVLDLQTGEGALFRPGGLAKADLDKHRVWVCPMFEPFITKLWRMDLSDLDALPDVMELSEADAPSGFRGYRRPGPEEPT